MIKVFGYTCADDQASLEDDNFEFPIHEMKEISFCTNPATLRKIAEFFMTSADEIEKHKDDFGHEHLQDNWSDWPSEACDIIIVNDQKYA